MKTKKFNFLTHLFEMFYILQGCNDSALTIYVVNRFNVGSIMLKGRDIHPCFFQAGCGYDSTEPGRDKGRRQTDDSSVSKGTRETSKEDLSRSEALYT